MPKIRALVVDDAVVIRRMICETLDRDPEIEVVGFASNGRIAIQKIPQVNPDVITLDVEMPEMNGLDTVREIRKTYADLPIIMFSSATNKGAIATLEALSVGANDYTCKPANVSSLKEGLALLEQDLIPKIKIHCSRQPTASIPSQPVNSGNHSSGTGIIPKIIAIGASTGGPNALSDLIADLQVNLSVPIVIVQHMPPVFTRTFAERLDKLSPNTCYEAEDGQALEPGNIYIAPGGRHMEIEPINDRFLLRLNDKPPENSCRPAADVLFRSVAKHFGPSALAIVLTGMGQDGLNGCHSIRERDGRVLAQDKESCVVWGMPRYISESGLADKELSLSQIAPEILSRLHHTCIS